MLFFLNITLEDIFIINSYSTGSKHHVDVELIPQPVSEYESDVPVITKEMESIVATSGILKISIIDTKSFLSKKKNKQTNKKESKIKKNCYRNNPQTT